MRFDGKAYLNYRTDLPFQPIHEEFPLLSNSTYRSDIRKLAEGKMEEAQDEKELLEELQRRDRKLREKNIH